MDEILFEGTHTRDKSFFKEIAGYLFLKRPQILILHILLTACLVFTAASDTFMKIPYIVVYILYAAIMISSYLSMRNLSYQRQLEASEGTDIEVRVQITDTDITHIGFKGAIINVNLSVIKSVSMSKNYVIMMSKTRQMYIIDKRKFEKGTPEELIAFLKDKGVK